jgi:NAD(P)-dependent dehydrogenase (short-subunit alcohol dehydrogenase family)
MTQRVLVTAGASGIGREIVRAFAAQGAKVFVCDIDGRGLDSLAEEIPGLVTKVCDISKRADIEGMVAFGLNALGGLDVLVNNAGISGPTAPVEEMDPDQWEQVIQINLTGTFNVTRLAIPHLKKSSAGVMPEENASTRILKKLGMAFVGPRTGSRCGRGLMADLTI